MFAPQDYLTFDDIHGMITHWQSELVFAECSARRDENTAQSDAKSLEFLAVNFRPKALVDSGLATDLVDGHRKLSFHHIWMLSNFMHHHKPYLCSPSGTVLSAPYSVYDHADNLYWCPWRWDLENSAELSKLYQCVVRSSDIRSSLGYRFPCLDIETGTVVQKNHQIQLMASAYGDLHNLDNTRMQYERLVRPFLGYSLCWTGEDFPEDWSEVFAVFGASDLLAGSEGKNIQTPSNKGNNARGLQATYLCLLEAFPDGKGDATWDEVEKRVGYSRRNIMRSLKVNNNLTWNSSKDN